MTIILFSLFAFSQEPVPPVSAQRVDVCNYWRMVEGRHGYAYGCSMLPRSANVAELDSTLRAFRVLEARVVELEKKVATCVEKE